MARSFDSGSSWTPILIDSASADMGAYSTIATQDTINLFAVYKDEAGNALRFAFSTDYGDTWSTSSFGTGGDYAVMTMTDALTFFVAAPSTDQLIVYYTTDGGSIWNSTVAVASDIVASQRFSISAPDASNVFVSYTDSSTNDVFVAVSTDAAASFTSEAVGATGILSSLKAVDASGLILALRRSDGGLETGRSFNAGVDWSLGITGTQISSGSEQIAVDAIDMGSFSIEFAQAPLKTVFVTNNGGSTYFSRIVDASALNGSFSSYRLDSNTIFVVLYDAQAHSLLFRKSLDNGATWSPRVVVDDGGGTNDVMKPSITAVDANTLFVGYLDNTAGNIMAAYSIDGGDTWNTSVVASNPTPMFNIPAQTQIISTSATDVFMFYNNNNTATLEYAQSSDGAQTWNTNSVKTSFFDTVRPYMIDASHFNLVFFDSTSQELVFESTDNGGGSFARTVIDPFPFNELYDAYFLNVNDIVVASSHGTYYSDTAGISWTNLENSPPVSVDTFANQKMVISAADLDHVFVAAIDDFTGRAQITYTNDRGHSWRHVQPVSNELAEERIELSVVDAQQFSVVFYNGASLTYALVQDLSPWVATRMDVCGGELSGLQRLAANRIIASYHCDNSLKYAFSDDGGANWTRMIADEHQVNASDIAGFNGGSLYIAERRVNTAGPSDDLYVASSFDSGDSWSYADVDPTHHGQVSGNVSISAPDDNTVFVSYHVDDDNTVLVAASIDAGASWNITEPDPSATGQESSIAALDTSNVYLSYYDDTGTQLKFASSNDGGDTWNTMTVANSGNEGRSNDLFLLDATHFYISFSTEGVLKLASSSDAGASWTISRVDPIDSGADAFVDQGTSIDATDTDHLYIAYYSGYGEGASAVNFAQTVDGGDHWLYTSVGVNVFSPGVDLAVMDDNSYVILQSDSAVSTTAGAPTQPGPIAPTGLWVGSITSQFGMPNPLVVTDETPAFSAICGDLQGDDSVEYELEADNNSEFASPEIATGRIALPVPCSSGSRTVDLDPGVSLPLDGTLYNWRIRFWDSGGNEGQWSTEEEDPEEEFTMSASLAGPHPDYSTYLGGSNRDEGHDLVVDGGLVYATSYTESTDFPTTTGAYDELYGGSGKAVISVFELNGAGANDLIASTFFGGSGNEKPMAIGVDGGSIFLTGTTNSVDLPIVGGSGGTPYRSAKVDSAESFIATFDLAASTLDYSSYLRFPLPWDMAVSGGVADIAAWTFNGTAPITAGAADTTFGSGPDGVYIRFSPDGNGSADLLYGTYLGGGDWDEPHAIITYGSDVAIVGIAGSADFPTTAGAFQPAKANDWDSFLAIISPDGGGTNDIVYSTFFGGDGSEALDDVAAYGTLLVAAGDTNGGTNYPLTGDALSSNLVPGNEGYEATFVVLDPAGGGASDLVYATFVPGVEHTNGLAVSGALCGEG